MTTTIPGQLVLWVAVITLNIIKVLVYTADVGSSMGSIPVEVAMTLRTPTATAASTKPRTHFVEAGIESICCDRFIC